MTLSERLDRIEAAQGAASARISEYLQGTGSTSITLDRAVEMSRDLFPDEILCKIFDVETLISTSMHYAGLRLNAIYRSPADGSEHQMSLDSLGDDFIDPASGRPDPGYGARLSLVGVLP